LGWREEGRQNGVPLACVLRRDRPNRRVVGHPTSFLAHEAPALVPQGEPMTRRLFAVTGITLLVLSMATLVGAADTQNAMPSGTKAKPTATSPVNLNTATTAELQTLPNVGPAVAARIIEYRQKNGGFKKIEDLMNIKGIGEKRFLKLKPLVTVAPPKTSVQ
jgi:comEA protein